MEGHYKSEFYFCKLLNLGRKRSIVILKLIWQYSEFDNTINIITLNKEWLRFHDYSTPQPSSAPIASPA